MALIVTSKCRLFNRVFSNVRYMHFSPVLQKLTQFILSDIGEGIREVTIRDWFVKVDDKVSQFDDICLVESDKASVNITSRFDGIIKHLHYKVGDSALVGKPLVDIDIEDQTETDGTGVVSTTQVDEPKPSVEVNPPPTDFVVTTRNKALATPAVRRIAMQHKISLGNVQGTGKAGRVMKEDILNYINRDSLEGVSKPIQTPSEEDKIIAISGIKKAMVKAMTKSGSIPTFGYCDEMNMNKLVELRNDVKALTKHNGMNITYLPFFIKAMSICLKKFPELNSLTDENCENMIVKGSHNIGIAVDTPNGLVVPNIKNVQNLTVSQINRELNILTENGRLGKLMPNDFKNGTISISNIGSIGGTYASPLINPPEVCILAIGKIQTVPRFDRNNEVIKSLICSLSWTADHRVIDGATVARFSNMFKEYVENPLAILLEV